MICSKCSFFSNSHFLSQSFNYFEDQFIIRSFNLSYCVNCRKQIQTFIRFKALENTFPHIKSKFYSSLFQITEETINKKGTSKNQYEKIINMIKEIHKPEQAELCFYYFYFFQSLFFCSNEIEKTWCSLVLTHSPLSLPSTLWFSRILFFPSSLLYLTSLDLSLCSLTDSCVSALSFSISFNSTLKTLHIPLNYFHEQGALSIAQALKLNNSLQTLTIGGNRIGENGVFSILQSLEINQSLQNLSLYNCFSFKNYIFRNCDTENYCYSKPKKIMKVREMNTQLLEKFTFLFQNIKALKTLGFGGNEVEEWAISLLENLLKEKSDLEIDWK